MGDKKRGRSQPQGSAAPLSVLPLPPSSPREVRADISTMNGALSVCEKRVQLINSCWLLRSYNKCVVWEAQRDALATICRFNARLSAKGYSWLWPAIAAALTSKHHWLVIACDSCDTIIDLDLTVKLPIGIAWTTFGVALQRLGLAS
jgi:hypothetical protein